MALTVQHSVDGRIDPNLGSVVPGLAKRRAAAVVRAGCQAQIDRIKEVARPSRRTGRFERGFTIELPVVAGEIIVGGFTNTAAHARALEGGRKGFAVRGAGPGKGRGTGSIPVAPGFVAFRRKVGPAQGRHFIEIGQDLAKPELRRIHERGAAAIANDIRGRMVLRDAG